MTKQILIKELIKDKHVGAVASTSKQVIKRLLNKIDFEKADTIIEYGSGNGVITKQLLNQMSKDAVLFAFETNKQFFNDLSKINDNRLVIINSDAVYAKTILKTRYKIEQVDYIVSTIPFTFIDKRKRRRIISRTYSLLNEKGRFITYQYTWLIHNLIKTQFSQTVAKAFLLNVPPVLIFVGIK